MRSWSRKQLLFMGILSVLFMCLILRVKGMETEGILFALCVPALVYLSGVDLKHYEIPLGCNVYIFFLGLLMLFLDVSHWYVYAAGGVLVSGVLLLVYFITRGQGIGLGDIKLMAAAGLLLGFQRIIVAFLVGAVAGSVIHLTLMRFKHKDSVLAFGPYLAFGIICAMLYGEKMIAWYLKFCGF